jgi:hypothetical protein
VSNGWSFGSVREAVEALRLDLSLGARHHLTGGEYVVTESEPGRAVLSPVEVLPKPIPVVEAEHLEAHRWLTRNAGIWSHSWSAAHSTAGRFRPSERRSCCFR